MTSSPPAGLRQRKKAKTRTAIRDAAMTLFEEQGYAATTVDQIAEAAEVSQSTFFRYFPTKEAVVLTDDYDAAIVDAIRAQPPGKSPVDVLLDALRSVFLTLSDQEWADEQRRQRLFREVPELRARAMQQTADVLELLGAVLAERAGRPAGDLGSRVLAGAMIGVVLAVLPPGAPRRYSRFDFDRLEEGMAALREIFQA
jgi:AcrR family transcriptional regulator